MSPDVLSVVIGTVPLTSVPDDSAHIPWVDVVSTSTAMLSVVVISFPKINKDTFKKCLTGTFWTVVNNALLVLLPSVGKVLRVLLYLQ